MLLRIFLFLLDVFFFVAPRKTCKEAMAVLTALRGPDSGNMDHKTYTTATIRGQVFCLSGPRIERVADYHIRNCVPWVVLQTDMPEHFAEHVREAAMALRMEIVS